MSKKFSLNPSGEFLMDFCYVNLLDFEDGVRLITGGNLIEKLQFFIVKRKIRALIRKVSSIIYSENNSDVDIILSRVSNQKNEIWDKLFLLLIIKQVASWETLNNKKPFDDNLNAVLELYLYYIKEMQDDPMELLDLKIDKIKIQSSMDLLIVSAALDATNKFNQ